MVFCQSDLFPDNFMIDEHHRVTAIDFADASILPSSFAKFALAADYRLGFDISDWVYIPVTEGVDNTAALGSVAAPMIMGSLSFWKLGSRLPGGDEETQNRVNLTLQHSRGEESDEGAESGP